MSSLRNSSRTPPPGPLPETERGRKTFCSPSPLRGGARGEGFSNSLSLPFAEEVAQSLQAAAQQTGHRRPGAAELLGDLDQRQTVQMVQLDHLALVRRQLVHGL